MSNDKHPPTRGSHDCRKVRLAQSSVAAVDLCDCGVMHVHLGVVSLRLCPRALSELISTLGQAVAAHAARRTREELRAPPFSFVVNGRGEA